MTAEIVIMNKHGLSLAADSAITSGSDGIRKVYNSANKLFGLSNNHPIGIMVYGSASFMEVPWDIIVKTYRNYLGEKKFNHLQNYMDHFLTFLQEEKKFNVDEVEEIIVYRIFSDVLKNIIVDVEERIGQEESESTINDTYVNDLVLDCIYQNMEQYKKTNSYIDMDYHLFKRKFAHVIKEIQRETIRNETPAKLDEKLIQLAYQCVKNDYFSTWSSGFVMTGYGEKEIFPQLLNYRLEGFVFHQLKYKKLQEKRISYTPNQKEGVAAISAFGQREMVDSFIGGIEPNMQEAIFGIIDKVLMNYYEQMQELLRINLKKEQVRQLREMGKTVYESIEDSIEEYKTNNYLEPLLDIVRSLPVQELAEMTETLINLTSFKRRVTRATESVGPPIDVAVITKGDGFVWLKKKNMIKN